MDTVNVDRKYLIKYLLSYSFTSIRVFGAYLFRLGMYMYMLDVGIYPSTLY